MQYESFISSGKKVMAKVKVFAHASNANADTDADADVDTRAMTLAPRTFLPAHQKCFAVLPKTMHHCELGLPAMLVHDEYSGLYCVNVKV